MGGCAAFGGRRPAVLWPRSRGEVGQEVVACRRGRGEAAVQWERVAIGDSGEPVCGFSADEPAAIEAIFGRSAMWTC